MKKVFKFLAIFLSIVVIIFLVMPNYVKKAVWYWGSSIDDYKIFHNRIIEAGEYEPWKEHANYNKNQVPDSIRQKLLQYKPVAALLIQNGEIKNERYWDDYGEDSFSNSFSAGKAVVSLLVGIALDEGKIQSLDQHVGDFIPAYNEGSRKELTIRHVLTMSSGLNWQEEYTTPFSQLPGLIMIRISIV